MIRLNGLLSNGTQGSGTEKGNPNLVLSAEGESKQTINVSISNETLRQVHKLLIEENRVAWESRGTKQFRSRV